MINSIELLNWITEVSLGAGRSICHEVCLVKMAFAGQGAPPPYADPYGAPPTAPPMQQVQMQPMQMQQGQVQPMQMQQVQMQPMQGQVAPTTPQAEPGYVQTELCDCSGTVINYYKD